MPAPEPTGAHQQTQYQLVAALGRGAIGEAYLAAASGARGPGRLAVIKRIWPELADDPDFVTMLLDEARLAVRLRHPNIAQTFEMGREGALDAGEQTVPDAVADAARYFMAMEYVAGQPLSLVLERLRGSAAFGLPSRLYVLCEVLAALEHAHHLREPDGTRLRVVHGDVSPHNVFVCYDGAVKLMDFGVAKAVFASRRSGLGVGAGAGVVKGSFAYGAPEQLQRVNVDRRADVFAVGMMLWELVTGRRMFRGRTRPEILHMLAGDEPLPPLPAAGEGGEEVPPELAAVCSRALAKQPAARYQSAGDFRADLAHVLARCLPPDPQPLGPLVAVAFASEKQTMEWLIERFRRSDGDGTTEEPAEEPSPRPSSSWNTAPAIEVVSEVTAEIVRGGSAFSRLALGAGALLTGVLAVALLRPVGEPEVAPLARPAAALSAGPESPAPFDESAAPGPAQAPAPGVAPAPPPVPEASAVADFTVRGPHIQVLVPAAGARPGAAPAEPWSARATDTAKPARPRVRRARPPRTLAARAEALEPPAVRLDDDLGAPAAEEADLSELAPRRVAPAAPAARKPAPLSIDTSNPYRLFDR
jgi:eukaryotic-like serine/threonine-protein kinase